MKGIVYINEHYYEFGEIPNNTDCIYIQDLISNEVYKGAYELHNNSNLMFSTFIGRYIIKSQCPQRELWRHKLFACNLYPYKSISRDYGVSQNLQMFTTTSKNYYSKIDIPKSTLGELVPYTLGVEFETSMGALPEHVCYQQGLIPLRDGSITGNEYSTVVLQGSLGIEMLKNQMDVLNKYTRFNKECAVHIHFGGFPVEPKAILTLNNLCVLFTDVFQSCLPSATFYTELYKTNKKSYCKPLVWSHSFEELYESLTSTPFFGCLYQPHPNDIGHGAKWNIKTRYTMCNLINMVCYDSAKTVEFRFLRPTKNVHVIYFWIYVLNALLQIAENYKHLTSEQLWNKFEYMQFQDLFSLVYSQPICDALCQAASDLKTIRCNQNNNGDISGESIDFEQDFKLDDVLL